MNIDYTKEFWAVYGPNGSNEHFRSRQEAIDNAKGRAESCNEATIIFHCVPVARAIKPRVMIEDIANPSPQRRPRKPKTPALEPNGTDALQAVHEVVAAEKNGTPEFDLAADMPEHLRRTGAAV